MKNLSLKKISAFILLYKIELSIVTVIVIVLGAATGATYQQKFNSTKYRNTNFSRLVYEKDILELGFEASGGIAGTLNVEKQIEEYDSNAKDLSNYPSVSYENGSPSSLGGGTTSSGSSKPTNSSGGSSVSSTPIIMDYSSLTGKSARILEGCSFNPLKDLGLSAKDKNGANITHKIEIVENNVDIYQPGHYTVKVRVKLSDGAMLMRQFNVEVVYQPLTVKVNSLILEQAVVSKGELNVFYVDIESSKDYVNPVSVRVNNQSYPLTKDRDGRYCFTIQAPSTSGQTEYSLSTISMSDGSVIKLNEKVTQIVKKDEPIVESLSYEFNLKNEKLITKIKLTDTDGAIVKGRYAKAILFDSNQNQIGQIIAHANQNNTLYFNVPSNGDFTIKVVADIDLTGQGEVQTVELASKSLTISSIDRTNLTGKNVTIQEGSIFDAIKDLQLQAIDKDGTNITNQIQITSDLDTRIPGEYSVKAHITNSDGVVIEKEFMVTVKAVKTEATMIQFETSGTDVQIGSTIDAMLELNLSKDYVTVKNVIINDNTYPVKRVGETNQYEIEDIHLTNQVGEYSLQLTKLELSNGEVLSVSHSIKLNMVTTTKAALLHEQGHIALSSDDEEIQSFYNSSSRSTSVRTISNQIVSGPDTNTMNANVTLSGLVRTIDGSVPSGRIEVTLPTSISFVVDQVGNLQLPSSLPVSNSSSVGIVLSIQGFTESQPQRGITVKSTVSDTDPRSAIALRISGNTSETVSLLHNGVTSKPLLNLAANSSGSLVLSGEAGKASVAEVDANGVNETFTITFSIKKQ